MQLQADTATHTEIEAAGLNSETHEYEIRHEIGGRPLPWANFGCPQCDRELVPGPWNSWICWQCDEIVHVEGGDK